MGLELNQIMCKVRKPGFIHKVSVSSKFAVPIVETENWGNREFSTWRDRNTF